MTSRQQFDEYLAGVKSSIERLGYTPLPDAVYEWMWHSWCASRAELVVVLPVIFNEEWACTSNECSAMRDGIRFCAQKIREAGVKTK